MSAVLSALFWGHLDQAMEETQEETVDIYWAQIFSVWYRWN